MAKRISAIALAILSALPVACGFETFAKTDSDLINGENIASEWEDTDRYSKLSTKGPDSVTMETGDTFRIRADGSPAVLKDLRFVVKDDVLTVGRVSKKWSDTDSDFATIHITAPALSAVSLSGSGKVKIATLSGAETKASIAGSGDAEIAMVKSENFVASIAGSGNTRVQGNSAKAKYSIAGSGNLDASNMMVSDAQISIAGSGAAKILASGSVKANIAGSGDVTVTGGAKCTSSVAGSGKVNCS